MKIDFVELSNFRKLKSVRVSFDPETTLLVGANNSGKTSAMSALMFFLEGKRKLIFVKKGHLGRMFTLSPYLITLN